jgi:hypothetical protein
MCSNIAILGHSQLVQRVQCILQISKQTIGQIVCLENANVEALIDNVRKTIVYFKEQTFWKYKQWVGTLRKYI